MAKGIAASFNARPNGDKGQPVELPHATTSSPLPEGPDAGPQLQKVLDFRKSLEESRQVLSHGFANEAEFKAEVDRHLRAFAQGELPPANTPRDKVFLPSLRDPTQSGADSLSMQTRVAPHAVVGTMIAEVVNRQHDRPNGETQPG